MLTEHRERWLVGTITISWRSVGVIVLASSMVFLSIGYGSSWDSEPENGAPRLGYFWVEGAEAEVFGTFEEALRSSDLVVHGVLRNARLGNRFPDGVSFARVDIEVIEEVWRKRDSSPAVILSMEFLLPGRELTATAASHLNGVEGLFLLRDREASRSMFSIDESTRPDIDAGLWRPVTSRFVFEFVGDEIAAPLADDPMEDSELRTRILSTKAVLLEEVRDLAR